MGVVIIEFIIAGIVMVVLVLIGLLNLNIKNKKISKFFEKFITFLKEALGYI